MPCSVWISGTKYLTEQGSLTIDRRIEQRSTARCTIVDEDALATFTRGMPVEIYDATPTLVFGGFIETPEQRRMAPKHGMLHDLLLVDNHYLADKRLVVESYVAGQKAGDIVLDIWDKYLKQEGVTVGAVQDGPTLEEAIFNHVKVTECYDSIKEASGVFIWFIDEQKQLFFVDRTTYTAPWNLDSVTHRAIKGSTKLVTGNPQHRNMQYVWGGTAVTDPRVQTFVGDGTNKQFILEFPCATEPTITEDTVAATVGIKGIDTGKDYYWSKGDPVLYADVAPGAGVDVEVTYEGQYPFIGAYIDSADIAARASLEGSSGIVEDIVREAWNESRDAARQSAQAKIQQYCQDAEKFVYRTYEAGLYPGMMQTITFAPFGLSSHDMLIESVRTTARGNLILHDISCVTGPTLGDWTLFFAKLLKRQDQAIRVGGELLLQLKVESESLTLAEAPATRSFDFTSGLLNVWVVTSPNKTFQAYNVEHERLALAESNSQASHTTKDYYYNTDPHALWDFATWA